MISQCTTYILNFELIIRIRKTCSDAQVRTFKVQRCIDIMNPVFKSSRFSGIVRSRFRVKSYNIVVILRDFVITGSHLSSISTFFKRKVREKSISFISISAKDASEYVPMNNQRYVINESRERKSNSSM